jgi:glycosyltransferase involved in cell wall biosynthesis
MKILIIVEYAKLGGHVLSSLTIAKELEKNGYRVVFAGGKGDYIEEMRRHFEYHELEFYPLHAGRQTYFNFKTLKTVKSLIKLCETQQFDLIHAFDAKSYVVAAVASIFKLHIPYTCTLCGGINPYYNIPYTTKMIVFSEEQKEKMVKKFRWRGGNIAVIRNRLDMDQFIEGSGNNVIPEEMKEYLTEEKFKIIMITNFFQIKKMAVVNAIKALELLLSKNRNVCLILIGRRGKYFDELKQMGEMINAKYNATGIIFAGYVKDAFRALRYADVVLGVGRSAFEGIAFRKPTLIVGENGYAGMISKQHINEIEHFNFSGRNIKEISSPVELAGIIENIMRYPDKYKEAVDFGRNYIENEIDVKKGIEKVMDVHNEIIRKFTEVNFVKKVSNLTSVLVPILLDNYYNAAKKLLYRNS